MALFCRFLNNFKLCTKNIRINQTDRNIKRWVAPTLRELEKRKQRMEPQRPNPRSAYLEWNYDAELYSFGKRLSENFNTDLLKKAFIHQSYSVRQELDGKFGVSEDNSQLIVEGDSIILKCIRQHYSNYPEEIIEAVCNYLNNSKMLARVAFYLGTKDIILSNDYPPEEMTLANTFKAIVGALNLSANENRAHLFVKDFLICQLNGTDIYEIWNPKNPYEILKELAREKGVKEIEPRLCNESASNTILANYQVGLYNNKKLLGIGWGETIEIAKDTAALDAIRKLHNIY